MTHVSESNAEESPTNEQLCGKWMPRKQTHCARTPNHGGPCATPESMQRARHRQAEWERVNGKRQYPATKRRFNQVYKLFRYGLTQDGFDSLLERQGYACGMCRQPFGDQQTICIDHDHNCCLDEKRSCGKCVRGLLCLSCNTALGQIERKYALAKAYLDRAEQDATRARQAEA